MGIIDLLKRGFKITNKNLALLLVNLIVFLFYFISIKFVSDFLPAINGTPFSQFTGEPEEMNQFLDVFMESAGTAITFILLLLILWICFAILFSIVQAGSTGMFLSTAKGETDGFEWDVFWDRLKEYGLGVVLLNLFWFLMIVAALVAFTVVVIILFAVLIAFKEAGHAGLTFGLGFILTALIFLALLVCLVLIKIFKYMSPVVLIGERLSVTAAISRTAGIIWKNFWDAVLTALIIAAILCAIVFVYVVVVFILAVIPVIGITVAQYIAPPFYYLAMLYFILVLTASYAVMLLDRTGGLPSPSGTAPVLPETPSYIPPAGTTTPGSGAMTGETGSGRQVTQPPSAGMEFPMPDEDRGYGDTAELSEEFPPQEEEGSVQEEGEDFLFLEAEPVGETEPEEPWGSAVTPDEPPAPAFPSGMKPAPPPVPGTFPNIGIPVDPEPGREEEEDVDGETGEDEKD